MMYEISSLSIVECAALVTFDPASSLLGSPLGIVFRVVIRQFVNAGVRLVLDSDFLRVGESLEIPMS